MKLRIDDTVYCAAVNPDTGSRCEFPEGHDGPHVHAEWYLGEIQGPVYWDEVES